MNESEAFGRLASVKKTELEQLNLQAGTVLPAIEVKATEIICNRCGQKSSKRRAALPNEQYFCPQCKLLGRLSTLDVLYTIPEPNRFVEIYEPLSWQGVLSEPQTRCAQDLKVVVQQRKAHLLWAVTGAGKTEMLFEALAYAIKQKMRICLASPRVDVCNELFPRLKKAFQEVDILLQHGRQEQTYRYTQFVVCTTHQLVHFYEAFDVLIIDEADAFPFVNDKMLKRAVETARKKKVPCYC
ncbi:DEAD/DEAH box helicase [Liquorilactobacillus capillatus]|nr:DEAD/DEAH box helicase [Liquorilactobacillus capillatus]